MNSYLLPEGEELLTAQMIAPNADYLQVLNHLPVYFLVLQMGLR